MVLQFSLMNFRASTAGSRLLPFDVMHASKGSRFMDRFVVRANIDHYLSLLNGSALTPSNRSTVTKLLITEEDKLGHDLEHLDFAETRTANSRDRVNHFKKLRDSFVEGSTDRAHADSVLTNFEAIHTVMEQFCRQMRERVNSRGF